MLNWIIRNNYGKLQEHATITLAPSMDHAPSETLKVPPVGFLQCLFPFPCKEVGAKLAAGISENRRIWWHTKEKSAVLSCNSI